ncbi:membrane integrity-associated transporter subunit PqiC [Thalassospira australica]|uniref:PqiC family protein n=1 Tax=Thalassospira australica TaxID=1528106 RepID=UPI0038510430
MMQMTTIRNRLAGAMLAMSIGMLGACSTPVQERYFVLSPDDVSGPSGNGKTAVMGIGPITIPSHLDRSQIVTRSSDNRLVINQFDRWAEPLDENIQRVLIENLDRRLHPQRIETFPWNSRDGVVWQIVVDIGGFERQPDGSVQISARWKIVNFDSGETVVSERFSDSMMPRDTTTEGTVAAMSDLLVRLSDSIARSYQ